MNKLILTRKFPFRILSPPKSMSRQNHRTSYFLKGIARFLAIVLILIFLFIGFLYIWSPIYQYPKRKPFSGNIFYNPYQSIDSTNWRKSNLHVHSRAWGGMTDGRVNTSSQVWDFYRHLGYQTIAVSNYQTIDRLNETLKSYVPVYEHGYGFTKNHQLCIGAREVDWLDYPFWQSLHNRQYIINRLKPQVQLLSINHPGFSRGVRPEDFSKLAGYDLIEVLNGFRISVPHWDSALSAGRPAFLIANDDTRNAWKSRKSGKTFTVYNAPSNNRNDLIRALKTGCAYGVYVQLPENETFVANKNRFLNMPVIQELRLEDGLLTFVMDSDASEIRFIGQDGRTLNTVQNARTASYKIKDDDTYIRTEVVFVGESAGYGLTYYLNPVIRTIDGKRPAMPEAHVNVGVTWSVRIGSLLIFGLIVGVLLKWKRIM